MTLSIAAPQTIETRTSDGTMLVADVWRPAGPGRHPVLLMRQPYGRRIASTVVLAHPAWYAAQGYVVMVQDVRGRGDSGGRFRVLEDDVADGAETLAVAADLPGGDGRVATYGFSYQGMTQYMALAGARRRGTKAPDAMAIVMAAFDVRDHWAYEGGAFRLEGGQMWALQMAAEGARIRGDATAYHALRSALGGLCGELVPARLAALEQHAPDSHYADWLADDPAYWRRVSPHVALEGVALDVPALHVGGWLDIMLPSTFAGYRAFAAGPARQELVVGPWPHLPWSRRIGTLDCGPEAERGIDREIVGFFDHVLKDHAPAAAPVRLFDLGTKSFRGFDALPPTHEAALYLGSTGRAAPSTDDGRLTPQPGAPGRDALVHDPWRPAPAVGLHLGTPGGYIDRRGVDARADVAVYTSAPLETAHELAGAVRAELFITADRPSFDVNATLSVLWPNGEAHAITGGHRRVSAANDGSPVVVDMRATCASLPKGARLRLSVQASAWPAFMINPGTGGRPEESTLADALVTTLMIEHGLDAPSRLVLSIV